jgi:hypothetical protein
VDLFASEPDIGGGRLSVPFGNARKIVADPCDLAPFLRSVVFVGQAALRKRFDHSRASACARLICSRSLGRRGQTWAGPPLSAATPDRTVRCGPAGDVDVEPIRATIMHDRVSNPRRNETQALRLMFVLRVNCGT